MTTTPPPDDIARLREEMEQAMASISETPLPADEARILKEAAHRDRRRWQVSLALLILGGPMLALLALFQINQSAHLNEQDDLMRRGIACLLAEMDDHRLANVDDHQLNAERHGFSPLQQVGAIELTKEQAAALKGFCEQFIGEAVRLGQRPGQESTDPLVRGEARQ